MNDHSFFKEVKWLFSRKMKSALILFIAFLFQFSLSFGQVLKGVVIDKSSKKELPYVNIVVSQTQIGSVTKFDGSFQIDLSSRPEGSDSLSFSIIGYKSKSILIPKNSDSLLIQLVPETFMLESVIVSPKTPLEYIQMAIDKIPENYINEPFNATIYFKTIIRLNGRFIESSESLIKGYIMPVAGEYTDTTRLKLIAFKYFDEEEEAIQSIVSKKRKKKGDKMAIDGLDSIMINMASQLSENVGIYTQIDSSMVKQLSMKGYPDVKTKYWFESLVRNEDRNLMKIGYGGSIKGLARQRGNILLEENSLAFEGFNLQISSSSLRLKALALLAGIGFKGFDAVLRAHSVPTENGWIPDMLSANVFIDMEKNKWFAKDIPIVIEANSFMKFLEVSAPGTDKCDSGRILKKKTPIIDQYKPDPNNPLWDEYKDLIREKRY